MVNLEKATEPDPQTPAPMDENAAPEMPLSPYALRKMIASGKSVPTKAGAK